MKIIHWSKKNGQVKHFLVALKMLGHRCKNKIHYQKIFSYLVQNLMDKTRYFCPGPNQKWSENNGLIYSKKYTASSCTDLDNARFWIGSKKIWDAQNVVKILSWTFFDVLAFALLSNSSCMSFSIPPKTCI